MITTCLTFGVAFAQVGGMARRGSVGSGQWTAGLIVATVLAAVPSPAQLSPVGTELSVSTRTTNSQNFPTISAADDGFIIVWSNGNPTSPSPDGDRAGVFGQRLANDGSRRGTEFQINTYTTGNQRFPSVAASPSGEFVAVWEGIGAGGAGVYAQRYDAAGGKQGTELQINGGSAFTPHVSSDAQRNFVVAWWGGDDGGPPAPGGAFGVFAQRYDSAGAALGSTFQVNTYTTNLQRNPAIATTSGGAFVVVWQSDQDGSNDGIFAQRYTNAGVASGTEFRVNTYTTGFQTNPAVAADDAGNFVVAWQSSEQDGSSYGVFGQLFDSAGTRSGGEFQANTYTPFDQSGPEVGMDATGGFLIAWGSTSQDGAERGVFAQEFDASGARAGTEFRVNTVTAGDQDLPGVSAIGEGAFAVAWDSGASGVFAQRYAQATPTAAPSPTPTSTRVGGCPGDCDGSKIVAVNELVRCVNISLEAADIGTCLACDSDGSGRVTIDELIKAVNALLRMCPS